MLSFAERIKNFESRVLRGAFDVEREKKKYQISFVDDIPTLTFPPSNAMLLEKAICKSIFLDQFPEGKVII